MSSGERTDKKPYKSLVSELYVDAPNYLAELICVRKSHKENSGALPEKFWNLPKYKNLYIREVSQARNLLKIYPSSVIIEAIQSYEAKWIMSYRNKKLIPIIKKCMQSHKQIEVIETNNTELVSQKPVLNNNPLFEL